MEFQGKGKSVVPVRTKQGPCHKRLSTSGVRTAKKQKTGGRDPTL